jgi:hypothetical protein
MKAAVLRALPYSLVGPKGLEATWRAARLVQDNGVPGDFVELGVARGGAAAVLGMVAFEGGKRDRMLWLFDSFEGLPEPTADDFVADAPGSHVRPLPKGSCLGRLAEVEGLLIDRIGLPKTGLKFVKGWFDETVPKYSGSIEKIAVLRIDADWYESTRTCLHALYDRVQAGGYVVVDDYETCHGCRKAVDEFLKVRDIQLPLELDGRGGACLRKLA